MSLSERIVEALQAGKSAGMVALLEDVEAAILAAERRGAQARSRALDPLLPYGEAAEARQTEQDATYERDRLVSAAKRLREAKSSFIAAEQEAERRRIYDDAIAKRDAAVESLRDWSELANALGEILAEVAAANTAVMIARHQLPAGVGFLEDVDMIARGTDPTSNDRLTDMTIKALAAGQPAIWGFPSDIGAALSYGRIFTPEITSSAERPSSEAETAGEIVTAGNRSASSATFSDPDAATAAPAASARTDEAGGSLLSAPSSVRLSLHDAGVAA